MWILLNENNVLIDISEEEIEGYTYFEGEIPSDLTDEHGVYRQKMVDDIIVVRSNQEMMEDTNADQMIEDVIEDDTPMPPTIEERVATLEECVSILLDGV